MNITEFQKWLNEHGQSVVVDGKAGPKTRAALIEAFVNKHAPAVTDDDIMAIANRLGCSTKQLRAISVVESGGAAFDMRGRPKMLFERHLFHRITNGEWSLSVFSNPKGGGYAEDSWNKLALAASKNPAAAFASASWGKFQVLGRHWQHLKYPSALEMAYSTVQSEANHYEMLARFIEANRLNDELEQISTSPDDNRAFARAYNGPAYERFDYHNKIAREMR